jgi:hypothetical protein
MIPWLLTSWPSQIAIVVFGVWFLNGLRKAMLNPRLRYVSHLRIGKATTDAYGYYKDGLLLTVKRQQLLPPWAIVDETWSLEMEHGVYSATRDGDGVNVRGQERAMLAVELHGVFRVGELRKRETAELTKEESRRAN